MLDIFIPRRDELNIGHGVNVDLNFFKAQIGTSKIETRSTQIVAVHSAVKE
jgi:hypothetical protein